MKIRKGFVSNSSSSSFICDVTGKIYSGYDACLSDFDLCSCENDHIFPKDLLPKNVDKEEDFDNSYVDPKYCPICSFKVIKEEDKNSYLMKKSESTDEALLKEIKEKFNNYEDFQKYLRS